VLQVNLAGLNLCQRSPFPQETVTLFLLAERAGQIWQSLPLPIADRKVTVSIQFSASQACWILEVVEAITDEPIWVGKKTGEPIGEYRQREALGCCGNGTNAGILSLIVAEGFTLPLRQAFGCPFLNSTECRSHLFCRPCRLESAFLQSVAQLYAGSGADFVCPQKLTAADFDPTHYPPILEQAENFLKAMGRLAYHKLVRQTNVLVCTDTYEKRYAVCRKCDIFDPDPDRCRKCGCWRSFKIFLKTERCPLDKW